MDQEEDERVAKVRKLMVVVAALFVFRPVHGRPTAHHDGRTDRIALREQDDEKAGKLAKEEEELLPRRIPICAVVMRGRVEESPLIFFPV